MSRKISACFFVFALALASFVGLPQQASASVTAKSAFDALKGNATLDGAGGSIHSQARSIYSLGGGMRTFSGKKITFMAVDPPGYGAGCAGISWHFGGFAFISMDELRQLVEAISQAALGLAVDLAIQTLCPQCYAVMSKLREIANAMRNAAADACRTAKNMKAVLQHKLGLPTENQTKCSEITSANNKSSSFLDSMAGKVCGGMNAVNDFLNTEATGLFKFLNGEWTSGDGSATPTKDQVDQHYNAQYEILSALGVKDGVVKDMLLNFTGMTIYSSKPDKGCSNAYSLLSADAPRGADSLENKVTEDRTPPKQSASEARTARTSVKEGLNVCHLPPRLSGFKNIAKLLICGFDPSKDAQTFASRLGRDHAVVATSAIGTMCSLGIETNGSLKATGLTKLDGNPKLYTCDRSNTIACTQPREEKYERLVTDSSNGGYYTGLVWEVADALERGVRSVANNRPLTGETVAVLNGVNYPLYRLINLAAIYPGMTLELLHTYSATIATEYAVTLLDTLLRPGAFPSIDLKGLNSNITHKEIIELRRAILNMIADGPAYTDRTLERLNKKNALIQQIININRAVQSEVITQGLSGNEAFAVNLKKQVLRSGN